MIFVVFQIFPNQNGSLTESLTQQGVWREQTGRGDVQAAGVSSDTACDADVQCRKVLASLAEDTRG